MTLPQALLDGDLDVDGRFITASNATFAARIGAVQVVYKPVAGERPLWDFPDGTLAHREVAAFTVSQSVGWDIVPCTWIREGPFGPGMVQLWRQPDPQQEAVRVVPADQEVPAGWHEVFEGIDAQDRPVVLIHEDSAPLRRMAIFDAITNNADRKGGHVLTMTDGHRHGVDHGLTFHTEHKMRTVLWGWAGAELHPEEMQAIGQLRQDLNGALGDTLADLITDDELTATAARCEHLLQTGCFPEPMADLPAIPWPPF